jgi:hypothetical protein
MANSRLTRTISSAGSLTTWTFSTWIKRSMLGDSDTIMAQGSSGDNFMEIHFDGSDCLDWRQYYSGAYQGRLHTNRRLTDTNGWYHIVCQWDTTNGTAGDRMKMWINGVQETSFQATTNPTSSRASIWNSTTGTMNIGSAWNAAYYFNGYQSHTAFVNGAIVAPTSFGETDSTSGIWKFKSPSGVTWGTNGFHLKYENSGNLGLDSSGQSSTFTVAGNLKQALDTPSNVYCTMNPLSTTQNFNLSNGNTTFGAAADNKFITGTLAGDSEAASTGYYFEYKVNASNLGNSGEGFRVGVKSVEDIFSNGFTDSYFLQETASNLIYEKSDGSSTTDINIGSASNGDIVMIAWGKGGKIWMGVNGVWADSGNPSAGTGEQFSGLTGVYAPCIMCSLTNGMNGSSMNFGNGFFGTTAISSAGSNGNGSLFEYDVPSGFYALTTKNINTYG